MFIFEGKEYFCIVEAAFGRLGSKWKIPILCCLQKKDKTFNEIERDLETISSKVLSQKLKSLEKGGAVIRTEVHDSLGRVNYSLTPEARELFLILLQLKELMIKVAAKVGSPIEDKDCSFQ